MNKAVGSVLFVVSFFLAACGKNSGNSIPQPSVADNFGQTDLALRSLLGVKGMDTEYQVPGDELYYCITTLNFEDGMRVGSGAIMSNCAEDKPAKNQRIHVQLLWRTDKAGMGIFHNGTSGIFEDPFWQKLNFSSNTPPPTLWEGYTVLGFATSNIGQDGQVDNVGTAGFQWELNRKKHVGALVIKTFKTKAELRAFLGMKSEAK